jgi:hypothetical protein
MQAYAQNDGFAPQKDPSTTAPGARCTEAREKGGEARTAKYEGWSDDGLTPTGQRHTIVCVVSMRCDGAIEYRPPSCTHVAITAQVSKSQAAPGRGSDQLSSWACEDASSSRERRAKELRQALTQWLDDRR